MVQLSRSLGGLDNVIEYRDVVPNSEINDCCGRKAGKGTKKQRRLICTIRDQEGAT